MTRRELRLLKLLLNEEHSASDCVTHVGLAQGRASTHLACLADCGFVTLAQLSSNASRTWLNRREVRLGLVWRFAVGASPFVALAALLLTSAPLAPLQRLLGILLIALVVGVAYDPQPRVGLLTGPSSPSVRRPAWVRRCWARWGL